MSFTLKLPVNSKLESCFPNDPHFDVTINVQNKQYKLQKAYLRLESDYFRKLFEKSPQSTSFTVNMKQEKQQDSKLDNNLEIQVFDKILRCFYGGKYNFGTNELSQAYHICISLEIDSMINEMNQSISDQIKDLNFFLIYSLAIKFNVTDLIEKAHSYLNENQFNLFREDWITEEKPSSCKYPQTLLDLDESMIRTLFKFHNSKKKRFLNFTEQFDLFKKYCCYKYSNEDDKEKWKEELEKLSIDLIDQSQLNAQEYKYIFHQEIFLVEKSLINNISICGGNSMLMQQQQQIQQSQANNTIFKLLKSENILYQKEIQELKLQNNCYIQEIEELKNELKNQINNVKQIKIFQTEVIQQLQNLQKESEEKEGKYQLKIEQLEQTLQQLKLELNKMEQDLNKKEGIIQKYQMNLNQQQFQYQQHQKVKTDQHFYQPYDQKNALTNERYDNLNDNNQFDDQQINNDKENYNDNYKLQRAFSRETINSYYVVENDQQQNKQFFQSKVIQNCSQFLKSDITNEFLIDQQMLQNIQEKTEIQTDSKDNIEIINFSDEQPQILSPDDHQFIKNLFKLSLYQKLKLKLVYRGSRDGYHSTSFKQKCNDLENLLIIVKSWDYEKVFGGYISVKYQDYENGYLPDEKAFIFSVTEKKKFVPVNTDYSLFFGEEFIICFGEDIKISNDCNEDETCTSQFPQDYNDPLNSNGQDKMNAQWLVGNQQFQVDDIEVFKVDIIQSMDI